MKIAFVLTGLLVLGLGLTWLEQGNDFFLQKVFSPQLEQVRHDTFKQSVAYKDGMIADLEDLQVQYLRASKDVQPSIRTIILKRAANADLYSLSPELRSFLSDLRSQTN